MTDGKLGQAELGQLFRLERGIGGAEVHRRGLDLGDAATRADRLVVDLLAGGLGVLGRPLRHDRVDERGAGAGDVGGERIGREGAGNGQCGDTELEGLEHHRLEHGGLLERNDGRDPFRAHSITVR
jgi:hypothetical protein